MVPGIRSATSGRVKKGVIGRAAASGSFIAINVGLRGELPVNPGVSSI
jgi:hypothetical protein